MPGYAYALFELAWLIWVLPLLLARRRAQPPERRDRRARWGLLLEVIAFAVLAMNEFWLRAPSAWRVALAIGFFVIATLLSWSAARVLGRHLRIDASLSPDHELVTAGVYGVVRHPIYTSMLCMLLATGLLIAPLPLLLPAVILFMAGTEIRVRVEERLLEARFGEAFFKYQRRVPAYIPFLR